ncbi:MAG: hypothetical protein QOJ06_1621 [Pseudonocardiales bacterium]|jgi:hypothetical protein|nr:hypothetical protein [Pseudonocardiales bacterium]
MVLRQQQQLSQRREAVALTRKSLAQRYSDRAEMWLDRTEFEELIRPPLAGTIEASQSDLKTQSDRKTTVTPAPTTVGASGLAGSQVHTPTQTEVRRRLSLATISPGSIDVQERRRAPRRFTRLAAAGILALAGGAASVPLMTSHSGSIATTDVRHLAPVAPVAAIPAPSLGNSPHTENLSPAPVAAPNTPAEDTARSAAAPVRIPQTVRSTTISRPRPPTTMMPSPPPQTPEIPAEAYAAWSRMAELSRDDHARTHFRRDFRPHR